MSIPSMKTWKEAWEEWDVRGFMILSLTLQMLLILLAPMRKRSSRSWITMPIWLAYLLADWAANFAVGLISRTQANYSRMATGNGNTSKLQNHLLLAYWAPFLLVHLGGPDTITAFALEDNELWLRHLLGLVFQSVAALYVLSQSWETNKLIPAAGLMFISGIIKYSERTRSLYLASLSRFRDSMVRDPDPGPNYAKLMDEYYSKKEARLPTRIQMIGEPDRGAKSTNKVKHGRLVDLEVVLYAQQFFQTFKGLIVGTIFSFRERNQSRDFFLARTAEDAFGVVEVELNFIYEALYTKVSLVCNKLGFFSRVISVSCVIASFVIFYSQPKKSFDRFDVGVTYTLLFGAIGLDCIAFVMLIQSDWFLAYTKKLPEAVVVEVQNQNQPKYVIAVEEVVEPLKCQSRHFFSRRWSESLSTYNLIHYCTHPRIEVKEKFIGYLGLKKLLDEMKYVSAVPFTGELRDHIFAEIWKKSELADNLEIAKEINEARGDWVLRVEGCGQLLKHTIEVDYDESIILWHLATEFCYNDEISHGNDCKNPPLNNKFRDLSKILSDYMMYLLVMQPTMMSTVIGIGQIRYRDTCAEAKRFLGSKNLLIDQNRSPNIFQVILYAIRSFFKYTGLCFYGSLLFFLAPILSIPMAFIYVLDKCFFCKGKLLVPVLKKAHNFHSTVLGFFGKGKEITDEQEMIISSACKRILAVNTEVKPVTVKGDRSKSVLFDGCILAKELQEMGRSEGKNNRKWEIVSKVWVELLCYAASHCTANAHAQQLTKGGELITIVWLLMAHFGLGDQFQISEGHARAKLIVGK